MVLLAHGMSSRRTAAPSIDHYKRSVELQKWFASACQAFLLLPGLTVSTDPLSGPVSANVLAAIHRTQHLLTIRQRTFQILSKHDDSILEVPNHSLDARKPVKRKLHAVRLLRSEYLSLLGLKVKGHRRKRREPRLKLKWVRRLLQPSVNALRMANVCRPPSIKSPTQGRHVAVLVVYPCTY